MDGKRFKILNTLTENSGLTDNGELMTFKEVVNKLNNYDNEIIKLRSSYNRCRNKNEALHKDWDKVWDICKEYLTEDEIIKELEK